VSSLMLVIIARASDREVAYPHGGGAAQLNAFIDIQEVRCSVQHAPLAFPVIVLTMMTAARSFLVSRKRCRGRISPTNQMNSSTTLG
jgi:hypothetical protein